MNAPTQPAPEGQKHAWYSEKQAEHCGVVSYQLVNGTRIRVTNVGTPPDGPKWEDVQYRGLVLADTFEEVDSIRRESHRLEKSPYYFKMPPENLE